MRELPDLDGLTDYRLVNAHLPEALNGNGTGFETRDIHVSGQRLVTSADGPQFDLDGAMIVPTFVDMHTHLDKGHIWPRSPNPDGSFPSALAAVDHDRHANWRAADVRQRMEFALRCAYAHGTRAIRTHIDSAPPQHAISWPIFAELRDKWARRVTLQAATIVGIDLVDQDEFLAVADLAAHHGGRLGCVAYPVPDLAQRLATFLAIAGDRDMEVDFHVDETSDPAAAGLRAIAEAVLQTGFENTVVAGHCCSLARQPDDEARRTLDLVAKANIKVVSLPMCNLYLQDRGTEHTPGWRGVTLVHEMRARGIAVAFASDNTRDPFYAYGDLDMVEVMREATRICHLDHSAACWSNAFSLVPAEICGFAPHRLEPGEGADFIVCSARNWNEFHARPQSDRLVVRGGRSIGRALPDYRELDHLMEAS